MLKDLKPRPQTNSVPCMEMEDDGEYSTLFLAPKGLPLLNIPLPSPQSPQHSGTATPPLQTSVSVPFKWEEKPGKPRHRTAFVALPEPSGKYLGLPPCRMALFVESTSKVTKTPSPTTVLDGPYNLARPKFSSSRFLRDSHDSFDSNCSASSGSAVDDLWIGRMSIAGRKTTGFLSRTPFKWKSGRKEVHGEDILGFSPFSVATYDYGSDNCREVKLRRNGSISTLSDVRLKTHLWAAIYGGIKQVIPWKSARKSRK